jgi:hypothetical protein
MTLRQRILNLTIRNLCFLGPPLIKIAINHGAITYVLR